MYRWYCDFVTFQCYGNVALFGNRCTWTERSGGECPGARFHTRVWPSDICQVGTRVMYAVCLTFVGNFGFVQVRFEVLDTIVGILHHDLGVVGISFVIVGCVRRR